MLYLRLQGDVGRRAGRQLFLYELYNAFQGRDGGLAPDVTPQQASQPGRGAGRRPEAGAAGRLQEGGDVRIDGQLARPEAPF